MGWMLKGFSAFMALVFLAIGAWPIFLLILAALVVPPLVRSFGRRQTVSTGIPGPTRTSRRSTTRLAVGALFFVLALIAFSAGGTISPLVFGGIGLLVIGWGRIQIPAFSQSMKPVRDSILFRTSFFPFRYTALVEVKPITRDLGKALSGLDEEIILTTSGTPAIHIAVSTLALTERSAEVAILKVVEKKSRGAVPLGVYFLPLDSEQSCSLLRQPLESEKVSQDTWALELSTSAYDLLSIKPRKGFAHALGIYRRTAAPGPASAKVPVAGMRFGHPPLLWEVFKSMEGRVQWPNSDRYTTFLSSIFATSYESIGSNIIDAGTAPTSTSQTVVVRSHSSPPVELSRAQLRAIMAVYSQGPPVVETRQPMTIPGK
jgi:hypothetical protein